MREIKLFISWSKQLSRNIAEETKELLESIFTSHFTVLLFEVDGGKRVGTAIDKGLISADLGVLILTEENYEQNWLLFEAGALHSISDESTAIPIVFENQRKMESPINDLARLKLTDKDFIKLCNIINKHIFDGSILNEKQLNATKTLFESKWSNYKKTVSSLIANYTPQRDITEAVTEDLANLMLDDSAYDNVVSRRERHLLELIDELDKNNSKSIIFFGGISSVLRKVETINKISSWLINNSDSGSKIFICYESPEIAEKRAKQLADDIYGEDISCDNRTKETIDRKTEELQKMKDNMLTTIGDRIKQNLFFVEINELLSIYITIHEKEMFMTPALDKRSSDTFTFKISNRSFHLQLLEYIEGKLEDNCPDLINEIKNMKQEIYNESAGDSNHVG